MSFSKKLGKLPRASGTDPGSITPASWNKLCDFIEELGDKTTALSPRTSADIYHKTSPAGVTSHLKRRSSSGGGEGLELPFAPTVSTVEGVYKWNVSSVYSTITDGTNGANLAISGFDALTTFATTKYLVATASVSSLEVSSISIAAVDDPSEVIVSGYDQTDIQLLIAKVYIEDDTPKVYRFCTQAQILGYDFLSGAIVRVFNPHTVHPDYAPPP